MAAPDLRKLGKYDVVRILGRGAMGTVYEGFDPIIDRRVAIKTVSLDGADEPEAAEDLLRFKREAQAAGRLTHPNIVGVYDYGETDEIAYIVMEYVEGHSLKSLLDKGERFAAADAVRMMEALLSGLAYSHEHGVIHRDIKPANVMITGEGRVKLADFGVARIESSSLTQAGTMIGTPSYMSPEQFMGQTIDSRTDIYSAGVMFYQLLTGEKPFEGSITAIMHKVLNVDPPAPSLLSISVTPKLDAIVRKAMSKRPDDRFATASEFAEALASSETEVPEPAGPQGDGFDGDATMIAGAVPLPRPPAATPAPTQPSAGLEQSSVESPRNRGLLLGGVAAVAVVIAASGAYFLIGGDHGPHPPPKPANQSAPAPVNEGATTKSTNTGNHATSSAASTSSPPAPSGQQAIAPQAQPVKPAPAPPQKAQVQKPVPLPADIEAKLANAIGSVPCAMASGQRSGDQYRINGMVGAADRGAFTKAVAGVTTAIPTAEISTRLRDFTGPYCGMVSAIRDHSTLFTPIAARLGFGLAGGIDHLTKGQKISVQTKLPSWARHLEIDYVSSNGQVYRLQPKIGHGGTIDETLGSVGAPFGRDMIVAIATSAPIQLKAGGQLTNTKTWPAALKAALSGITENGGHVATAAVLLDTTAK